MTKKRILIASAIIAGVLVAGAAGYYFTVYKKNAEANKVYDIIMSTAGAGGVNGYVVMPALTNPTPTPPRQTLAASSPTPQLRRSRRLRRAHDPASSQRRDHAADPRRRGHRRSAGMRAG